MRTAMPATVIPLGFKPCPFCGGITLSATSKYLFEKAQDADENGVAALCVSCPICGLDMWQHSTVREDYDVQLSQLREKWNRRATE